MQINYSNNRDLIQVSNSKVNVDVKVNVNVNVNLVQGSGGSGSGGSGSGGSGSGGSGSVFCNKNFKFNKLGEENINSEDSKYLQFKHRIELLENIYVSLGDYKSAELLHNCSTYLEFMLKKGDTLDKKFLKSINMCKMRLCPHCQYRRSLKLYSNMRKICEHIIATDSKHNDYKSRFIFMTLTTKNCKLSKLSDEVDNILLGFDKLRRNKIFKSAFLGFMRSLEITIDRENFITKEMYLRKKKYYDNRGKRIGDINSNYLYCNVHIHTLLHTKRDIYTNNYITQLQLTDMWKEVCNLNYKPIVDIRSFRSKAKQEKGRELAELVKYTVKQTDYMRSYNLDINIRDYNKEFKIDKIIVRILSNVLFRRRLYSLGGTFRQIQRELKLIDDVNIKDKFTELEREGEYYILKYYYNHNDKIYKRIK